MGIELKQVSSLIKARDKSVFDEKDISSAAVLRGEEYSYQIVAAKDNRSVRYHVAMESPIAAYVELYFVRRAVMDHVYYADSIENAGVFLTKEPGMMPDILMPAEKQNYSFHIGQQPESIWVRVKTADVLPGAYPITIKFTKEFHIYEDISKPEYEEITFNLTVLSETMPKLSTKFTQWFHADCIANVHNVDVYSEAHWALIDRYLACAADMGLNMILTPVITPPLDTSIGYMRNCVQLAQIEKVGEKYTFDFSRVRRFISLLDKNGIQYIEIMHLFSQWGLRSTPNILIRENGEDKFLFNWDISAQSEAYKNFLEQFIPALVAFLKQEGVFERCFFHVSDEPNVKSLERYEYASNLVRPMLDGAPVMDALSHLEFYERGYTDYPVCSLNSLEPFLERKLEGQWTYYCCNTTQDRANRFMGQPSYRNRIIGLQMYKYDVKGFLQWGYNYYNEQGSRYPIDPYQTSSSEQAFPSGDPFSVYPDNVYGCIPSLRAIVFKEALQDIEICRTLEKYIGKEAVVSMIEEEAGMEITLANYPHDNDFIIELMAKMKAKIAEFSA